MPVLKSKESNRSNSSLSNSYRKLPKTDVSKSVKQTHSNKKVQPLKTIRKTVPKLLFSNVRGPNQHKINEDLEEISRDKKEETNLKKGSV